MLESMRHYYKELTKFINYCTLIIDLNVDLLYLLQFTDSEAFLNAPLRIQERSMPSDSEYW